MGIALWSKAPHPQIFLSGYLFSVPHFFINFSQRFIIFYLIVFEIFLFIEVFLNLAKILLLHVFQFLEKYFGIFFPLFF